MDILCPRCKAPIHPGEDRCTTCGLTSEQLEQLIHANKPRSTGHGSTGKTGPSYYATPTYGLGPAVRGVGPTPPTPPATDIRREDAIINLTDDGGAEIVLPHSGASVPLPPAAAPPAAPRPRAGGPGSRRVELILLLAVVLVACTIIAALLKLASS
jgi:hypothetical protein